LNSVRVCWALPLEGVKFPTAQACPELRSAAAPARKEAEPGFGLDTMLQLCCSTAR
jgi:hypothetical protein